VKQLKIAEYYERLATGIQTILDNDKVKEFLRVNHMFRRYSFANTIMIYIQRPIATRVAGMLTWNKLGRRVIKGEKGIAIFAPLFRRPPKEREADDTQEIVADPDGTVRQINESGASRLIGFKIVHVYDISQTDGKDLPVNAFSADTGSFQFNGDVVGLYEKLLRVCPVPVKYGEWENKAKGYYSPHDEAVNGPAITLRAHLADLEKPEVLLHEWAHHIAITELREHTTKLSDRPEAEVVAEGAAFVANSYFGLDTSGYSFPYVAAWGQDVKKILSWGSAVQRVASRIIETVERTETTDFEIAA
jgi:hypothetical protein